MCGVVAVLGPHRHALELALLLLSHRGIRHKITDCASGYVGHVRLPIVGLGEDNDQPMWQPPWLLGFVGELLDFRDLDPSAECDAPLVQDLWHKSGPEGFTKRDGFWGIAAINQDTDELHVFCDYLAQKPMYYRTDVPSAASEINALRPFGPVTLDKIYLGAVIKWGYCPELERTPFCEIKHVLPGEHVVLSPDGSLSRRIADPLVPVGTPSHGLLYREMDNAVRRRMAATDVPVACLLSGGVDSAIVYTLAACYGTVKPYYVSGQDNGPLTWSTGTP
jgi:asparagine synthetase B (glutamine-hydrolysing)